MGVPITRTSFSSAASAMKTDPQAAPHPICSSYPQKSTDWAQIIY